MESALPSPESRAPLPRASMSWIKPGSGLFRGAGSGVFHSLSTSRRPSGRQAAGADLSSRLRRSRRRTFAVTTSFRMTAVTATLRALPPRPGPAVHLLRVGTGHAGRHRRHVQDVPRTPPPAGDVAPAPEGAAVAGEGGDAGQGGGPAAADGARPARPGDRGRGRDRADARHRGRMPQLSARPSDPSTSAAVRRPDAATPAPVPARTPWTGPSASGPPASPGTASARRACRRAPRAGPACRGACRRSRPPAPWPPCPGTRRAGRPARARRPCRPSPARRRPWGGPGTGAGSPRRP